jgi:hypothetical protein
MAIQKAIETGILLFIGLIALKAMGGIEGLTNLFSGITGMFDGGKKEAAQPVGVTPDIVTAALESGATVEITETAEQGVDLFKWFNPFSPLSPIMTGIDILGEVIAQPETAETTISPPKIPTIHVSKPISPVEKTEAAMGHVLPATQNILDYLASRGL